MKNKNKQKGLSHCVFTALSDFLRNPEMLSTSLCIIHSPMLLVDADILHIRLYIHYINIELQQSVPELTNNALELHLIDKLCILLNALY